MPGKRAGEEVVENQALTIAMGFVANAADLCASRQGICA
jgi:hypothetical protein